jgi:hypothetical protein
MAVKEERLLNREQTDTEGPPFLKAGLISSDIAVWHLKCSININATAKSVNLSWRFKAHE